MAARSDARTKHRWRCGEAVDATGDGTVQALLLGSSEDAARVVRRTRQQLTRCKAGSCVAGAGRTGADRCRRDGVERWRWLSRSSWNNRTGAAALMQGTDTRRWATWTRAILGLEQTAAATGWLLRRVTRERRDCVAWLRIGGWKFRRGGQQHGKTIDLGAKENSKIKRQRREGSSLATARGARLGE